jgi:hypothetical protein
MKTDSQIVKNLLRARELIVHGWIKGTFCITRFGKSCEPDHPWADAYCPLGAIAKATGVSSLRAAYTVEATYLAKAIKAGKMTFAIVGFNDDPTTTKEIVLRRFARAIVLARRETNVA